MIIMRSLRPAHLHLVGITAPLGNTAASAPRRRLSSSQARSRQKSALQATRAYGISFGRACSAAVSYEMCAAPTDACSRSCTDRRSPGTTAASTHRHWLRPSHARTWHSCGTASNAYVRHELRSRLLSSRKMCAAPNAGSHSCEDHRSLRSVPLLLP